MATKTELLKEQDAKVVGKRIDALAATLSTSASELHAVTIQCMIHVREHGNTGLLERLLERLAKDDDGNKTGASMVNVKGLRFWITQACPMIDRQGSLSLMRKDSTAYEKYLERNAKLGAKPDETMLGSRAFFIDYWSEHPFWANADVERDQRQNITPLTIKRMMGNVFALERQFNKAKDEKRIAATTNAMAQEFLDGLKKFVSDFREKHAADILREEKEAEDLREGLALGESEEAEANIDANKDIPEEAKPEVGGDVTAGVEPEVAENPIKTGTEG